MASAFLGLMIGIGTQALSSRGEVVGFIVLPFVGYISLDSISPFVVPGLLILSIYLKRRDRRTAELKQRVGAADAVLERDRAGRDGGVALRLVAHLPAR